MCASVFLDSKWWEISTPILGNCYNKELQGARKKERKKAEGIKNVVLGPWIAHPSRQRSILASANWGTE